MKKPTMIISRKHLVLSCLTLILGVAVYLNYVLSGGVGLEPARTASLMQEKEEPAAAQGDDLMDYGTAEMVNATPAEAVPTKADYFAQARLDKQTSRDHAVQTLQSIIGGGDLSQDEMVTQAIDAVTLSKLVESESVIENLILSQGYSDCVVYLDQNTAKVVLETEGLDAAHAAAIKEIILTETEVPAEGIRIFEVSSSNTAQAPAKDIS